MDDYLEFDDIIIKVDEMFIEHKQRIFCSECGKMFFLVERDPESNDLVLYHNEDNIQAIYFCFDHILYDLLIDTTSIEYVTIPQRMKELFLVSHARAKLFLNDRRN